MPPPFTQMPSCRRRRLRPIEIAHFAAIIAAIALLRLMKHDDSRENTSSDDRRSAINVHRRILAADLRTDATACSADARLSRDVR